MGSPFFVPRKEVQLIDALNEELIDEIVGQTVDIYKISTDETDVNMYGEAVNSGEKTFEKGFRVHCLINFAEPDTEFAEFGSDRNSNIEMYFHNNSLSGSDFYPEIGDIADWNGTYYELNSVTEPQLIAGNPEFSHQVKAIANRVRLSSVNFDERKR
tara:strand:- start:153 stop:623 length:471 start_codon:yes stop_codon:yes gene_type:complete